jgi:hypothetical protein
MQIHKATMLFLPKFSLSGVFTGKKSLWSPITGRFTGFFVLGSGPAYFPVKT